MNTLQEAYADTNLSKTFLKLILPENLYESKEFTSNDYLGKIEELPDDPLIQKLDDIDEGNAPTESEEDSDLATTLLAQLGWVDQTGVSDVLNSAIFFYKGDYLNGILSLIAAIPMADVVVKPLMTILQNTAIRKLVNQLGKCFRKFDAETAARLLKKVEEKFPEVGDLVRKLVELVRSGIQKLGEIAEAISKHWLKFTIVKNIITGKIQKFFDDLLNFKEKIKNLVIESPETVLGIISYNAKKIKSTIIDIIPKPLS